MPVDNENAGLDKYLSDVILWDENNVALHLEELTSEEIEHLRQEFENCIIKIGAEIKKWLWTYNLIVSSIKKNVFSD